MVQVTKDGEDVKKIRRSQDNRKVRASDNERFRTRKKINDFQNEFGLLDDRSEQWMAANWKKKMLTTFYQSRECLVLHLLNSEVHLFPTPNEIMYGLM